MVNRVNSYGYRFRFVALHPTSGILLLRDRTRPFSPCALLLLMLGWVLAGVGPAVSSVLFGQTVCLPSTTCFGWYFIDHTGQVDSRVNSTFIIPIVLLRYVPPEPGGTITTIKPMATSNNHNRPIPPQPIHEPTRRPCQITSSAKGSESTIGDHNGFNTFLTQSMSMVISSSN